MNKSGYYVTTKTIKLSKDFSIVAPTGKKQLWFYKNWCFYGNAYRHRCKDSTWDSFIGYHQIGNQCYMCKESLTEEIKNIIQGLQVLLT